MVGDWRMGRCWLIAVLLRRGVGRLISIVGTELIMRFCDLVKACVLVWDLVDC